MKNPNFLVSLGMKKCYLFNYRECLLYILRFQIDVQSHA